MVNSIKIVLNIIGSKPNTNHINVRSPNFPNFLPHLFIIKGTTIKTHNGSTKRNQNEGFISNSFIRGDIVSWRHIFMLVEIHLA